MPQGRHNKKKFVELMNGLRREGVKQILPHHSSPSSTGFCVPCQSKHRSFDVRLQDSFVSFYECSRNDGMPERSANTMAIITAVCKLRRCICLSRL